MAAPADDNEKKSAKLKWSPKKLRKGREKKKTPRQQKQQQQRNRTEKINENLNGMDMYV